MPLVWWKPKRLNPLPGPTWPYVSGHFSSTTVYLFWHSGTLYFSHPDIFTAQIPCIPFYLRAIRPTVPLMWKTVTFSSSPRKFLFFLQLSAKISLSPHRPSLTYCLLPYTNTHTKVMAIYSVLLKYCVVLFIPFIYSSYYGSFDYFMIVSSI